MLENFNSQPGVITIFPASPRNVPTADPSVGGGSAERLPQLSDRIVDLEAQVRALKGTQPQEEQPGAIARLLAANARMSTVQFTLPTRMELGETYEARMFIGSSL